MIARHAEGCLRVSPVLKSAHAVRRAPLYLGISGGGWISSPSPYRLMSASASRRLIVSPEVREALRKGLPVVALESTIISHGMPFPENLEMARDVENIVRRGGAVPATVAVLAGRPHVGLDEQQLEGLASGGPRAWKCSRRDLAVAMSQGVDGATTVAATAYLASLAGVRVFVTGGVGGVHRGGEATMDISADLAELARTPVVVVCAGVKSVLDIEKTLEVLETNGVPVVSLGTDEFPAFFSPSSGVRSPLRLDTATEVAEAAKAGFDLGMSNGMLVAVPNRSPSEPGGGGEVEEAIQLALREVTEGGVKGRDVSPFVLARVNELTGGASLRSNMSLVRENARVGTEIAVELAVATQSQDPNPNPNSTSHSNEATAAAPHPGTGGVEEVSLTRPQLGPGPRLGLGPSLGQGATIAAGCEARPRAGVGGTSAVAVFGGAVVDTVARPEPGLPLQLGTSTPGAALQSLGGVGRNVAEGVARLLQGDPEGGEGLEPVVGVGAGPRAAVAGAGCPRRVVLASVVGEDTGGTALVAGCEVAGVGAETTVERVGGGAATAGYFAVLDSKGDLCAAVADMGVFTKMTPEFVERRVGHISSAGVVVADGNLPPPGLQRLAELCLGMAKPLVFEPTSVAKSLAPVQAGVMSGLTVATPNLDELEEMAMAILLQKEEASARAGVRGPPVPMAGVSRSNRDVWSSCIKEGMLVDAKPMGSILKTVLGSMVVGNGSAGKDGVIETKGEGKGEEEGEGRRDRSSSPPLPPPAQGSKHLVVTLGSAGAVLASAHPVDRQPSSPQPRVNDVVSNPPTMSPPPSLLSTPPPLLSKDMETGGHILTAEHFPALPLLPHGAGGGWDGETVTGGVVNCTGAGDCLAAGVVGGMALGWGMRQCVMLGMLCARESIQAESAVPDSLDLIIPQINPSKSPGSGEWGAFADLIPPECTPKPIDPWSDERTGQ